MAAHPIRDEKKMCSLLPKPSCRLVHAGLPDPHRLRQFGDEELIFVGGAYTTHVSAPEAGDRQCFRRTRGTRLNIHVHASPAVTELFDSEDDEVEWTHIARWTIDGE
jgi:hypothetical protein